MSSHKLINPLDINLDVDNPRFSLFNLNKEEDILDYLTDFENIKSLAINLIDNGYIYLGERLIVKSVTNNKKSSYVVLEGNRRIAALKLIFNKQNVFNSKTREKIKLLSLNDYYVQCDVINEEEEEVALYKIASKHIEGIKEWSSTDKKVFYNKLFDKYRHTGLSQIESVNRIKEITPDSKSNIKKSIRELRFINSVYNETYKQYSSINNLSHLSTDVLTSRVLPRIKEELSLKENEDLQIDYKPDKKKIYKEILTLLGKATWIDKTINTRILHSKNDWKKISEDGQILPELKIKLDEYKNQQLETVESDASTTEQSKFNRHEDKDQNEYNNESENAQENNPGTNSKSDYKLKWYRLFLLEETIHITQKNYNLIKNIKLYDSDSNAIPNGSSVYNDVKFNCIDNNILIKNNIVKPLSKNGVYDIQVKFKNQKNIFKLNLEIEPTYNSKEDNNDLLIDFEWYMTNIQLLQDNPKYFKIRRILKAMREVNSLSSNDHNVITMSLLLRLLIECFTKAYLDKFTKEPINKDLPQLINQVAQHLLTTECITKEQRKSFKSGNELDILNGNIHDYKTNVSIYSLQSIFQTYKLYLEKVLKQINIEEGR